MCEGLPSRRYPLRELLNNWEDNSAEEERIKEAFTKLSAETIAKLVEEEPDIYTIEDVKVRYR
jgi:hypothetical protein